jgi:peptide/nickel transport system substrate-binding protein
MTAKLSTKDQINSVINTFSKKEWAFFIVLVITLFISTLLILQSINKSLMVSVPLRGGSISEGIIGTPRFINPILANSPADLDMVSLIYSGLMRKNPDGTLSLDLAKKYDMSKDGLTYTFTLKDKIYFQDGKKVTADDVIFTINEAKDSVIKSPHKIDWDGVTATKINDTTIVFTLKQPYPSFLENATLGIMPSYLWNNAAIELNDANTSPVGSGPYMIKNVAKESSGVIDSYELAPFKKFILGEPFIENLSLHFYASEDDAINALETNVVDQISSITPLNANILKERNYQIESSVLPRVFGLFFNQNQNHLFTDKVITNAIDQAIDKDKIIREVLYGYGVAIDKPIPPNMIAYQTPDNINNISRDKILQNAQNNLAKDGWSKGPDGFLQKTTTDKNKKKTTNTLEFSISTGNAGELAKAADLIKKDLSDIGIKVDVKTFEVGNLNQSVIRPRKYDALLFGEIINHESDLFAFWHSSQRKDPGLNVAQYTNAKVDKILEDASITIDEQSRIKKYMQFEDIIKQDMPAVFLYSPNFIYVVSQNLKGLSINNITSPKDRFSNVYLWYTETQNIWKIFSK